MIPPLDISSSASAWYCVGLAILLYGIHWGRNRSKLPLPPGPKKLPILGNLFDIPSELQWEVYFRWSREFNSDIIHLNAAGTSIVVLSSAEAIRDLLERRSSLYSDRPHGTMLDELMGWSEFVAFMDHGEPWRARRKLFHETFNVGAANQFYPQLRAATHSLLRSILRDPQNLMGHLRHMPGKLIMDVTYGIEVLSSSDPYVKIAEEAMHGLSVASVPGNFLVDIIPALKYVPSWFPGAGFKRKAKRWRKITRDLIELPFAETKRNIAAGTAPPSFTSLNLSTLNECKGAERAAKEKDIEETAAAIYAAGADTTVSVLGTFVLAMLKNPGAQKEAQAELDTVVGYGHLPDFSDEPTLPYLSAIVKEVLRWQNVTPIGVPHRILVDDEYRGYMIPAGSIVIGNTWAVLHDEEMYPDPHSFKPERFLLDGKLNPKVRDPETAAFGFGRRTCPGKQLAWSSLWLTVASVLATMDISKAVDKDGKLIEPSYEYSSGLIYAPLPFKCSITPRSRAAVEVIEATVGGG
ncbi:cytochrome P450 [Mycena capillaripes]|nr:cytochrome P450 [Mycena capillaripes]